MITVPVLWEVVLPPPTATSVRMLTTEFGTKSLSSLVTKRLVPVSLHHSKFGVRPLEPPPRYALDEIDSVHAICSDLAGFKKSTIIRRTVTAHLIGEASKVYQGEMLAPCQGLRLSIDEVAVEAAETIEDHGSMTMVVMQLRRSSKAGHIVLEAVVLSSPPSESTVCPGGRPAISRRP